MRKNTKSQNIQLMFNKIAKKYDLMNYIMSLGNHKKWEQEIVESININSKKTGKICIADDSGLDIGYCLRHRFINKRNN